MTSSIVRERAEAFCDSYGLRVPILQAPMSGACPPALGIAVANAGGMAADGALLDDAAAIAEWVERFRTGSSGPLQLNTWVPDAPADGDARTPAARAFLDRYGRPDDTVTGVDPIALFDDQLDAMIAARQTAVSTIMGLVSSTTVQRLHVAGIAWFACATTVRDAVAAQRAGADAVVAQGAEAGGHRGTVEPDETGSADVGLFALLPATVDALDVPVIAAGGIADGRSLAAALLLGASAVQIGTALLRCPETGIDTTWADELTGTAPEDTVLTRAYSGRRGRAVPTAYVRDWQSPDAPPPATYPQQRTLLARARHGDTHGLDAVNHWAGQRAATAQDTPAAQVVGELWAQAETLLR